jgi:hypothetical protein
MAKIFAGYCLNNQGDYVGRRFDAWDGEGNPIVKSFLSGTLGSSEGPRYHSGLYAADRCIALLSLYFD